MFAGKRPFDELSLEPDAHGEDATAEARPEAEREKELEQAR